MQFGALDYYIKQCEQHLDSTGTRNTEIENYFVQLLLIRICAEYETRIGILIERRCSRMKDARIKDFMKKSAREATKHFRISHISGILDRFGGNYKQEFQNEVSSKPPNVAWDNIYNNRQQVAHTTGIIQMTFTELKTSYTSSLDVFDALVKALELKPREIKDLV